MNACQFLMVNQNLKENKGKSKILAPLGWYKGCFLICRDFYFGGCCDRLLFIGVEEADMGSLQRVSGILGTIGLCVGISFGSGGGNSLDCTKLNETLCAELMEVASETTKIAISIFLPWPELDSICKTGGVPRPDTNGICRYNFEDSAYVAMLREAKEDIFNTYELWSSSNPSQRLQEPEEHSRIYRNVLATKATIVSLCEEEYISTIEEYQKYDPAGIRSSKVKRNPFKDGNSETFLINGRKQGKNPTRTPKLIRPL